MSTSTPTEKTTVPQTLDARVLARTLQEGYGPGAWHGADMKAALDDVTPALAFWRPAPGRHNIAEIALHHAYFVRQVRGQLSGSELEPFVLQGRDGEEDWFALDARGRLSWPEVKAALDTEQRRLAGVVTDLATPSAAAKSPSGEQFELVLGITCHAVYHAGQVQLLKRLHAG